MAKVSSKWEESKPTYTGQDRIKPWNTLGRLLIIHNLQCMLEHEFHLPRRTAKMELLKLLLLPQRGKTPSLPHSWDSIWALRFRNGLICHRWPFFLMSEKERPIFGKFCLKPGILFFISLKQRWGNCYGDTTSHTGKRKASGQQKYYSIRLNQRRNEKISPSKNVLSK